MLKTIILDINKLNTVDSLDTFISNSHLTVIIGMDSFVSGREIKLKMDSTECEHSFLITDNRKAADLASRYGIGTAVYTNEGTNPSDFPEALYCIENICDMSDRNLERMYLRFKRLPWDILETEHYLVREITLEDVDSLYELYSDYETKKYIDDLFPNREDEIIFTKDYISNQYRFFEYGLWVVIEKETGNLIGRAGIFDRDNQELPELGFVFKRSLWGSGASTEVLTAIMRYAMDELSMNNLCAHTVHENERSKHLLLKLGFKFVGPFQVDKNIFDRYAINL